MKQNLIKGENRIETGSMKIVHALYSLQKPGKATFQSTAAPGAQASILLVLSWLYLLGRTWRTRHIDLQIPCYLLFWIKYKLINYNSHEGAEKAWDSTPQAVLHPGVRSINRAPSTPTVSEPEKRFESAILMLREMHLWSRWNTCWYV